jgi:carbonic anhydrase
MTAQIVLTRNETRAAQLRGASRDLTPALRLVIITCADHRVDPAHVLGIDLGEAVVLRNPGGRVTRDVLRSLAVLSAVASIEGLQARFEFLVLHHTDCGLARLASPGHAQLVSEYVGVSAAEVPGLALADPRASAAFDGELLAAMLTNADASVTAAVYDLVTGEVEVVSSTAGQDRSEGP